MEEKEENSFPLNEQISFENIFKEQENNKRKRVKK